MTERHYGYIPSTPDEVEKFTESVIRYQSSPLFSDVAAHLKDTGKGKLSRPYKAVQQYFPKAFTDDPQQTGDCTSHGTRNAVDITRCVDMLIKGEPGEFVARGATEPIYGARGFSGQGMSPAVAARWVNDNGYLLRKRYEGVVDLTQYDASLGTKWGARGVPENIRKLAAEYPCKYIAQIRSIEEVRDALANGYGVILGTNLGFSQTRDANGFSRREGSWGHCMAIGACDDTGPEPSFLLLNSWAVWNSGGHPEWGPIPGGSFLIHAKDMLYIVGEGEVWMIGDAKEYPAKPLSDFGIGEFA